MTRMGVSRLMILQVPAYPGCPGQRAVKRLCVVCVYQTYNPSSSTWVWVGECFFFLYRHTRVVVDKGPLNGCVCVCVSNM